MIWDGVKKLLNVVEIWGCAQPLWIFKSNWEKYIIKTKLFTQQSRFDQNFNYKILKKNYYKFDEKNEYF